MLIDKNRFTAEELRQYENLTAKGRVPESEMHDDERERKSQRENPSPELAEALKRLERLEKLIERSRLADVARKYTALGEDENELAETLGKLKKSDPASYDAYISVLDRSLELAKSSGLFTEIGKSGMSGAGGSVLDKINIAASEFQKSDPSLSRATAVAKAWESHPELAYEYDMEYRAK